MVDVRPFRALRPTPALAGRVCAPPYDVVDVAEARGLAAGNPDSILRVTRPEIDLPDGTDPSGPAAHQRAAAALADLVARGVLVRDREPGFLAYRQQACDLGSAGDVGSAGSVGSAGIVGQTGVVGCAAVADYLDGTIRTHEKTRADKEDDRARHVAAVDAHDEPVFLLHRRSAAVDAVVAAAVQAPPLYDLVAEDGVRHTVWRVPPGPAVAALVDAYAEVPVTYVADGHHRSAAAARVCRERHAVGAGPGEHDAFLAVLFAADELHVLAYHRVILDLGGRTEADLLTALERDFVVTVQPAAAGPVQPATRHEFGLCLPGRWVRLQARPGVVAEADPLARLDVSVLQDRVLGPLLGITDPRRDPRLAFVGGSRGTAELQRQVAAGAAAAVSLHPTSTTDLMALADRGLDMPPKSTWFEPKLRSGLFLHPLH